MRFSTFLLGTFLIASTFGQSGFATSLSEKEINEAMCVIKKVHQKTQMANTVAWSTLGLMAGSTYMLWKSSHFSQVGINQIATFSIQLRYSLLHNPSAKKSLMEILNRLYDHKKVEQLQESIWKYGNLSSEQLGLSDLKSFGELRASVISFENNLPTIRAIFSSQFGLENEKRFQFLIQKANFEILSEKEFVEFTNLEAKAKLTFESMKNPPSNAYSLKRTQVTLKSLFEIENYLNNVQNRKWLDSFIRLNRFFGPQGLAEIQEQQTLRSVVRQASQIHQLREKSAPTLTEVQREKISDLKLNKIKWNRAFWSVESIGYILVAAATIYKSFHDPKINSLVEHNVVNMDFSQLRIYASEQVEDIELIREFVSEYDCVQDMP